MNYSNNKLVKHLLVLMLSFVFSSSFSQIVTQYGPYQIGNGSDNLRENAIYVQKQSPYKIVTAHNSGVYSSGLVTKHYISTNDGANWFCTLNECDGVGWCDPTVTINNNNTMFYAYMTGFNETVNIRALDLEYYDWMSVWSADIPSTGCDRPFLWYDGYNDKIYLSVIVDGKRIYTLTGNGFTESYTFNSDDEEVLAGDVGIKIKSDNVGKKYVVYNQNNLIKFSKTNGNNFQFGQPVTLANDNYLFDTPTIAVNESGNIIIVVYTKTIDANNRRISPIISTDGGSNFAPAESWPIFSSEQFYPWISYCKQGTKELFAIVFYDRPGNNVYNVKVAYSSNIGQTGESWNLINSNSSNLHYFNQENAPHDYIGLDMVYKNNSFYIYPVFTDFDNNLWKSYIAPISLYFDPDDDDDNVVVKNGIKLFQNSPNPFNPVTNIKFNLEKAGYTTLKIHNVLGELIKTVVDANLNSGAHSYNFNGTTLASGIYYYILESNNTKVVKKMLLIK